MTIQVDSKLRRFSFEENMQNKNEIPLNLVSRITDPVNGSKLYSSFCEFYSKEFHRGEMDDLFLYYHADREEQACVFKTKDFPHSTMGKFLEKTEVIIYRPYSVKGVYDGKCFISFQNSGDSWSLYLTAEPSEEFSKLIEEMAAIIALESDPRPEFKILTIEYSECTFSSFKIASPEVNLELSYGKDFLPIHEKIMTLLEEKSAGVYIFRGNPGTGKSTYIKYLAGKLKRPILYIPEALCDRLSSPEMIKLLINEKGSVLVLEDAERAVAQRDGGHSPVSTLLNLSDGILGDLLNISVIVTFNTGEDRVDSALMRKGRCHYNHEFKPLSTEDAKKLAKNLGKDESLILKEMTVGEVYNMDEENNAALKKKENIGFSS